MSSIADRARALLASANEHQYEPEPEGKSVCVKCGADGWNRRRLCQPDYRGAVRMLVPMADELDRLTAELAEARGDFKRATDAAMDAIADAVAREQERDAAIRERDDLKGRIDEIRRHAPAEFDGEDFVGTVMACIDCPHGEPGHYWKDGCPACWVAEELNEGAK